MGRHVDDSVKFTTAIGAMTVSDTSFRTWMNRLKADTGARPEWPLLLRWMLEAEFNNQQKIDRPYTGPRILIDRTQHDFKVKKPENRAIYGLYHKCLQENNGCLRIGDERVWLLSYEMPNQGSHRKRCADLVGLTKSGGLVVFEGKLGNNSHPPISAILEGLDYLSCLTSVNAFDRLILEFLALRETLPVPVGFENVQPIRSALPAVVVLADSAYFGFHDISQRSVGWREMIKFGRRQTSISIKFATAEPDDDGFFSRSVSWLT